MAFDLFKIKTGLSIENGVNLIYGVNDPTAVSTPAPKGSIYSKTDTGDIYHKTSTGNTDWTKFVDAHGSSAEDGFQNSYTGKPGVGSYLPQYNSITQISNNDTLVSAIGKIDAELGIDPTAGIRTSHPIITSSGINANITALDAAIGTDAQLSSNNYVSVNNTVNQNMSIIDNALFNKNPKYISGTNFFTSTGKAVDSVAVSTYSTAEWLLTVNSYNTPANKAVYKVIAVNDGVTTLDYTSYGVLTVNTAITTLSIDVIINAGTMELIVAAGENIDFKVQRISQ